MMDLEYFIVIVLGYILYPYILVNLCYILMNKSTKEDIKIILNFFILPIAIYSSAFITSATGFFFSFIQNCSKYLLLFYIITYFVVFIRFIINKIKNKKE